MSAAWSEYLAFGRSPVTPYKHANVATAREMREHVLSRMPTEPAALLLSGGFDSGVLAPFMPPGSTCYTMSLPEHGDRVPVEVERASRLVPALVRHVSVPVTWDAIETAHDALTERKGCPLLAFEAPAHLLARAAVADGYRQVVTGIFADLFSDPLRVKDRTTLAGFLERWYERRINPASVLVSPHDVSHVFRAYEREDGTFDPAAFMTEITVGDPAAMTNAIEAAGGTAVTPYAGACALHALPALADKPWVREWFNELHGASLAQPKKLGFPLPMRAWLRDWAPTHPAFKPGLKRVKGKRRFMLWSLERWLRS